MRMKAFLVKGVFMFAALASLTSIFIGISDAQVSAVASFNDPRCAGEMVCPNDPLLFTCTVTKSTSTRARVTLPSGEAVDVTSANITEQVGTTPLPDGVTVVSNDSVVVDELANYTLTLAINRASLLGGNPVICDSQIFSVKDEASCPIATDPGPPESLSQNVSANTETSAVVQWGSPTMTGVNISEYRVTVDGVMTQTVSHDDSGGVFTATITVLQFNTNYSVSVTAINSCGLSSQPATTTVSIEARLPPRPHSVSLSMECSVSNDRSVNISWMNGMREPGIVYPGEQNAIVVLTPGNIDCTVAGSTSCTASFTKDDNYTLNLTLNNDIGSSEPVIHSFNSMALLTEESLRGSEPSVTVTVNENCSNAYSYDVSVSFGVREKDSNGDCGFKDEVTENISPMESETFKVNKTKVLLIDSQEYCFDVSFQETTISPPEPTVVPEGLKDGEIAGIAIAVVFFIIGVVIGFIIGFIFYRKMKQRPQSDQEMKHLSSSASDPGSPVARDAAAVSSETGEVLYTEVDPNSRNRATEQVQPGPVFQDPTSIEHQEGPSGDLYAMPQTSGKKGKKEKKKGKGKEGEAEQQELTEEEKAALYSVPDKKAQKAKSQGLTYADIDIQRSTKPAPPSQGSYYADIKL